MSDAGAEAGSSHGAQTLSPSSLLRRKGSSNAKAGGGGTGGTWVDTSSAYVWIQSPPTGGQVPGGQPTKVGGLPGDLDRLKAYPFILPPT